MDSIGKLLHVPAQRDAIHVAIAPVVAAEEIQPGEHCGFIQDGDTENVGACRRGSTKYAIGIVDPFLTSPVKIGERFWMFLYPNTVTSLRHEWTHPAFGATTSTMDDKAFSEQWLRRYATKMNSYDDPEFAYDRLLKGIRSREIYAYGTDLHGLSDLADAEELRQHAEAVLGIRINWDDYSFSCGC